MTCDLCGAVCLERFDRVVTMTAHRECLLREVTGGIGHLIAHDYWCNVRADPDAGLTRRQSALLVDLYVALVGLPS